jgi:hypothetical protein
MVLIMEFEFNGNGMFPLLLFEMNFKLGNFFVENIHTNLTP